MALHAPWSQSSVWIGPKKVCINNNNLLHSSQLVFSVAWTGWKLYWCGVDVLRKELIHVDHSRVLYTVTFWQMLLILTTWDKLFIHIVYLYCIILSFDHIIKVIFYFIVLFLKTGLVRPCYKTLNWSGFDNYYYHWFSKALLGRN